MVNFRTIAGSGKDDSKMKRIRKGLEKVHTVRISRRHFLLEGLKSAVNNF